MKAFLLISVLLSSAAVFAHVQDLQDFASTSLERTQTLDDDAFDTSSAETVSPDAHASTLKVRSGGPHPHPDPRLFLVAVGIRMIAMTASKAGHVLFRSVFGKLCSSPTLSATGKPKASAQYIARALQDVTVLALTVPLAPAAGDVAQEIDLGADAGGKARRSDSARLVTWDAADDGAAGRLDGRPVLGADVRELLLREGRRNVTFVRHEGGVHGLAYGGADGARVVHLRAGAGAKRQRVAKHVPLFDAGGAGVKICASFAVDAKDGKHARMDKGDAGKIAAAVVKDLVTKRGGMSVVGYVETFKDTGKVGHRLCYIAEDGKFGLGDELGRCFGT